MTVDDGGLRRAGLNAAAGAIAGAVSRTVVSPLDVIKIRFQVQVEPVRSRQLATNGVLGASKYTGIAQAARDIVREEGLIGLWRGNVPALLLVMPYTAIQFVVLEKAKDIAAKHGPQDKSGGISRSSHFVSGSIAGAAATIGSYPFDLLRTILASQGEPKVYLNMRSAFTGITHTKGIIGLYAGLGPSLVEIIPYAGLQFGSYDTFKRWTRMWTQSDGEAKPSGEMTTFEHFLCGLGAGTFAKTCCHPLDVVKKRFQVGGLRRDPRYGVTIEQKAYKGMADALQKILEREGWRGLYKGVFPSIVKAAPASAITFAVYEWVISFGKRQLSDGVPDG